MYKLIYPLTSMSVQRERLQLDSQCQNHGPLPMGPPGPVGEHDIIT